MPKLANTITVNAVNPTDKLNKISIKASQASLRKKRNTAGLPSATASAVLDTLKRNEKKEMRENEERAKLLISRLNQDNITASPGRFQTTIEASSPESIRRNA